MTRQQKIIIISVGTILVLGVGLLVFLYTQKNKGGTQTSSSQETPGEISTPQEETPIPTNPTITQETENPVVMTTYRNNTLYVIDERGALWKKTSTNDAMERIGSFTIENPFSLAVSPHTTFMLIGEGGAYDQRKFSLLRLDNNETIHLPSGTKVARFLTDNELIYYKNTLAQTGIFTYDVTKKKERLITPLAPIDPHLHLIGKNLLVADKATHGLTTTSFIVNLSTGQLSDYFSGFLGATFRPITPNKVLAFLQNPLDEEGNNLYNLVVLDTQGRIINTLSITTMPEKCVSDTTGEFLYCAIPVTWSKSMPELNLPDDYYMQKTDFTEKFYRINLTTFAADELTSEEKIEDAINPILNEDQTKLYYYDRKTQHVFSLILSPAQ